MAWGSASGLAETHRRSSVASVPVSELEATKGRHSTPHLTHTRQPWLKLHPLIIISVF